MALRVVASFFIGKKGLIMKFEDLLSVIENGIRINAKDGSDNDIISFYSGTSAIDDTTKNMVVAKIKIVSATVISVILNSGE